MNYLLLEDIEKVENEESFYLLENIQKVKHINTILKKSKNQKLKAIKVNCSYGIFTILEKNEKSILGKFRSILKPKPNFELSLICAVQRPQTTKKILQIAGMFGIQEIYFFYAQKSRLEYLTSSIWKEQEIHRYLVDGMQQGGNVFLPKVFCNVTFDSYLKHFQNYHKVMLNKQPFKKNQTFQQTSKDKIALLIGPESGFTPKEILQFQGFGFAPFKVSQKILRSEQALLYFLAQWEMSNFPF